MVVFFLHGRSEKPRCPKFWAVFFVSALFFLLCGVCPAAESGSPGPAGKSSKQPLQVRSIDFEGNASIDSGEIKKIMTTKAPRFRWFFKAPFDENEFREDLARIQSLYVSQGFYHMRLLSHEVRPVGGNRVSIVIRIEEGPPMMVTKVDLTVDGPTPEKWRRSILEALPIKAGARFATPGFKDIEKTALRFVSDQGYPKAKVDLHAKLDKRTNEGTVSADITVGPKCTFGAVRVEGNESVETRVVMREVTFRKGEVFNGSKVEETQRKLFGLDLFQFVDVTVENMEDESTALPVRILVKEMKKQTIRLGVGYGTEDQLRGQAQYEVRNFLGGGRRLQINAKASFLAQLLEGRLTQPYLFSPHGSLLLDGGFLYEDAESFKNRKIFIRPVYEYRWNQQWVTTAGYNFEANRLSDVALSAARRLINDQEHQEYYISSLIAGNTWERVDSTLNPKKGWRLLQNMEYSSNFLGSEVDYFKLTLEGRAYVPTFGFGVLAGRLKWGGTEPMEETDVVPIFKRFFSGGGESVRGYPYQRLGPLDEFGNPIGGMGLVEGSLEWRFPIKNPLEGVVFFDFGNVAPDIRSLSWNDTRYTVGIGARYLTVVGPIRLDIGYELNPPDQEFFSPYQFHFSIGQAF
ncbi:MAG: outer membrane protein assembly factor BamA [Desulfobacteraceae bacterium]|nr:outer membrane protein assembly factor BamA [Desulfobacteraceae bacterium]